MPHRASAASPVTSLDGRSIILPEPIIAADPENHQVDLFISTHK
jgi:hypothetical protein